MPGTRDARRRILEATEELVALGGPDAATPAAVAERAGAGKMSLYRHFAGKDELVAEALAEHDPAQRAWLIGESADLPPRERLLAMFDRSADLADRLGPRFIGCPFVKARYDVSGECHPALPVVVAHKDEVLRELAGILTEIGSHDPETTAAVVLMLLDGAAAHALIRGNGDPLREARAALPGLLSTL